MSMYWPAIHENRLPGVVLLMLGLLLALLPTDAKMFERCELARELLHRHQIPASQIATWVCIARYESEYNSAAEGHAGGDGSGDHGLFQISDLYWCSRSGGNGKACGKPCSAFRDDDISDDVACIKKIHAEHKGLSGDGFNAWAVYRRYCHRGRAEKFTEGCFNGALQEGGNELGDGAYGTPRFPAVSTRTPQFPSFPVSAPRFPTIPPRTYWFQTTPTETPRFQTTPRVTSRFPTIIPTGTSRFPTTPQVFPTTQFSFSRRQPVNYFSRPRSPFYYSFSNSFR